VPLVAAGFSMRQSVEQSDQCTLSQLGNPHPHRRQAKVMRQRDVVEARNGDLPRNIDAG
jgi:hypothetical protein